MTPPKHIQVTLDVATQSQAAELNAAWQEIVAGQRAVEEHPGTGQARRLVRFLAGLYNGGGFPFDLTDLRVAKAEVHTHLPGGRHEDPA